MKKILLSVFCCLLVFSCSKENLVDESASDTNYQNKLTHAPVSPSALSLDNNVPIKSNGYSLVNGVLYHRRLFAPLWRRL